MIKIRTTQFDLYGCKHLSLFNSDACKQFLIDLVDMLEMRIIPEKFVGKNPITFWFGNDPAIKKEDEGVTGTIALYESHAAFHAWPNQNSYVCVVVSSCKPYVPIDIASKIVKYLNADTCEIKGSI